MFAHQGTGRRVVFFSFFFFFFSFDIYLLLKLCFVQFQKSKLIIDFRFSFFYIRGCKLDFKIF